MEPETIARESRSSIEVHRDAKGAYSWTIKRYQGNSFDVAAILADIDRVEDALRERYLYVTDIEAVR
jgi:hypothetical protein